ncbi:MAG: putative lipid II flippase FtsW [Verrucomicrobia bacterium]|nr:putative lipid II flippase FtsW [Verrucomicrobiota bacterium]MCF7708872.1 putative lipid II flippase FtsW [Verrucomicrobiota bacterium]
MKWSVTTVIVGVAALIMIGLVALSSYQVAHESSEFFKRQAVFCVIGAAGCLFAALLNYRYLRYVSLFMVLISFVLLILVLIPGIGENANGSWRWVRIFGFRFQPSELAKVALIIGWAHYGALFQGRIARLRYGMVYPVAVMSVFLGLIFLEPDWGTTMLFAALSFSLLFLAGARILHIAVPIVCGIALLGIMIWHNPLRLNRITKGWLYQEEYKQGVGYQGYQSKIAIGAGGLDGRGLGDGVQKYGYIPEQQTDFIFSLIGEEMGIAGTLGVVCLYLMITVAGLRIAWKASDLFGFLLAAGVTLTISVQAIINIGVVTSLFPNKGLPLPFISYGGSNLVVLMFCVGIMISVARFANQPSEVIEASNEFYETKPLTA